MQGKSHPTRWAIGASMFTLALVLLSPTVSHAVQRDHHQHEHRQHGNDHQHPDHFSVPEPSANVLLLLGLGVTSLVSYGVQRRKRGA